MTYAETTIGHTIGRLLSEHPDLNASADGALDNLDQFHIGGAGAVGLLIGSFALARTTGSWTSARDSAGPPRQIARRTGNRAGPALPMLLDDGNTRVINYAAALRNGSLEVWRGSYTRDAGQLAGRRPGGTS